MFKYLSIISIFTIIAVSASAQIYLRKDGEAQSPSAAVPQQAVKPSTAQKPVQNQATPQATPKESAPSQGALNNARNVANTCLGGKWESQPCLKAVSQNNLVMASEYSDVLGRSGKAQEAEFVKQKCAASTAASKEQFPAYAMRSAFTECVNAIPSVASATGVVPDQSQFQLLVAAIQCLDKTDACAAIEQSLAQYKN